MKTVILFGSFTILLGFLVASIKVFINFKATQFIKKHSELQPRLTNSKQLLLFLRYLFLLSALILCLLSLYKVKSIDVESTKEFESTDILFVVDVSLSMNAIDVKPNRLKRFQDLILRTLPELKGNRIGIIVFAGQSFSFCPMTTDLSAVSDYIQSLGVEMVGTKGTNLGVALDRVGKVLKKNQGIRSSITVIVTDGEDHEKQSLPDLENEVMVWGIGTEEGGPIEFRDPGTGKGGFVTYDSNLVDSPYGDNVIVSKLNKEFLESIAEKYNGEYSNISFYPDGSSLLIDKVKMMKKNKIQRLEKFKNEDGAHPYLLLSLLFFLFERIFSIGIQKKSPLKMIALLFFLLLFQNRIEAWELDPGGNAVERGVKSYQNQNFSESQKEFSNAKEYIQDDPRLLYNESASAYQLGKYKEAKELSEKILSHPKANSNLKSKANLTLGNIFSKLGQKENALNSYVESLKQNPNQLAAKKNIEHLTKKNQSNQNPSENQKQGNGENSNPSESKPQNDKTNPSKQKQSDIDRMFEPFSNDSILKNKRGGPIDYEKFW
ncbi:VWA domain-containing protein BatB [Leptospira levettii]|uniref:VWA domain-containing protein n=1 Tax=Leptospira levettii TaxID=2023178 RepID=A0AAW5VGH7_9LEPT|nr:VWA domain-containing protein [Leptospira levettii]MCW7467360.1 VWA domain-containing protein [Leptospira levettii]MCW7513082.1 VWA domain-containing protein [Leptospira levettii]MCW7516784.1 VWA domain-containing protein [Leptospira levettii]